MQTKILLHKSSTICFKMSFIILSCRFFTSLSSFVCFDVQLFFMESTGFFVCFTHLSNKEWKMPYSRQISHLHFQEWYRSTNCCLICPVYCKLFNCFWNFKKKWKNIFFSKKTISKKRKKNLANKYKTYKRIALKKLIPFHKGKVWAF